MSKSREQLNEYLKQINIWGKTVLDVGVQDKPASKYARGTAKKYATLDVDDQWKPDIVADLNNLYSAEQYALWGSYDVVFCIEVLEHVWNPLNAVQFLSNVTKEVCYISTPFVNPIHDYWDYLRYTFQWYEDVLPKYGFKRIEVQRRTATAKSLLMSFFKQEGMRMSKVTMEKYSSDRYFDVGYFVSAYK